MDKQHENRNSMLAAVDQFFIERAAKIEGSPALKKKAAALHQLRADIDATLKSILTATTGKAAAKAHAEENMLNSGFDIKAALLIHAQDTMDHEMEDLASIPDWKLANMRDTQQKVYCTSLYELALASQEALAEYEVTPEEIAAFKTSIDLFSTTMEAREASPASASALRKTLLKHFTDASVLLGRIDELMKRFRTKDSEFYNGYKSARTVKDVGIRHNPAPEEQTEPAEQK